MSAYKTIKTQMTNANILRIALEQAKPEWAGHIEVPEPGKSITIRGDSSLKGELVVKKGHAGTYSDIGVVRAKDGSLSWKISDVDDGSYYRDAESRKQKGKLFDKEWQTSMAAEYGVVERAQEVAAAGAQIGQRQVFNHPQWGQVIGVRCRIKKSAVV